MRTTLPFSRLLSPPPDARRVRLWRAGIIRGTGSGLLRLSIPVGLVECFQARRILLIRLALPLTGRRFRRRRRDAQAWRRSRSTNGRRLKSRAVRVPMRHASGEHVAQGRAGWIDAAHGWRVEQRVANPNTHTLCRGGVGQRVRGRHRRPALRHQVGNAILYRGRERAI